MSEEKLPPHLKIAESVTEEEYQRSLRQSRILTSILLVFVVVLALPSVWLYGLLPGGLSIGVLTVALDQILHRIFKDAHKAKTDKMKRYKELRVYRQHMAGKE